jgi:hypothetical protein
MTNKAFKTMIISITAAMAMSISAAAVPAPASYNEPVSITASEMLDASPEAVKGISAKSTANSITLKWKSVSGATGYRVYRYDNGKWVKVTTTKKHKYTDSSLDPVTAYKYKVKAYTKKRGSTKWGKASATFKYYTTPENVTFTSAVKDYTSITLNWKEVDCTGYQIYMKKSNGTWEKVDTLKNDTLATTYTINDLKEGTKYSFKVGAFSRKSGTNYFGAKTSKNYTTLSDVAAPSAPTVKATSTKDSITANWNDVQADGYQILLNGKVIVSDTTSRSYTFNNLDESTSYTVKVRAYRLNRFGEKVYSEYGKKTISTKEAEFLDTLTATEKAYYNLAIGYPSAEDIQLVKDDCIAYTFEKFGGLARGETVTWTDQYGEISITPPAPVEMVVNTDLYANDAIDTNAVFLDGTSNVTRIDKDNIQKLTNVEKKEEINTLIDRCHVGTADMFFGNFLSKFNSGKWNCLEFNIGIFSLNYTEFNVPKYQITFLY